jgi:hypothetical protein
VCSMSCEHESVSSMLSVRTCTPRPNPSAPHRPRIPQHPLVAATADATATASVLPFAAAVVSTLAAASAGAWVRTLAACSGWLDWMAFSAS